MKATERLLLKSYTDRLIPLALFLLTLGVYVATLAPTVLFADGGEFQFVANIPGIAHPTGYPLYTILAWVWSKLVLLGDAAYRVNLFSAIWAALTTALLYRVMLIIHAMVYGANDGRHLARVAAVAACLTFAFGPTYWSEAIIAEVYSMHSFLLAGILYLALHWLERPSPGRLRLVAVAIGLGLTHHATTVFLIPGVALLAGLECKTRVKAPLLTLVKEALKALPFILIPLLLYLYIPLAARHTPYTTLELSPERQLVLYEQSAGGFWRHITAEMFAGEVRPQDLGAERLALWLELWSREFTIVGVLLSVAGVFFLALHRAWRIVALTGTSYALFVIFNFVYFIGDVEVLFIATYLISALWLMIGLVEVGRTLKRLPLWKTPRGDEATDMDTSTYREDQLGSAAAARILPAVFLLLPLFSLWQNWEGVDQSRNYAARDMWQPILEASLPSHAILLSNDRNEIMPLWYYQYVEGIRQDLLGLFPLITHEPDYADIGALIDTALETGRPVFLVKPMPGIDVKATLSPSDSVVRVLPPPSHISIPVAEELGKGLKLLGANITPYPADEQGGRLAVELFWQTSQPLPDDYTTYVHLVNEEGEGLAQNDHLPGGVYYPPSLWKPGEVLRDLHYLATPETTGGQQCRIFTGAYYLEPDGQIQPLGERIEVTTLDCRKLIQRPNSSSVFCACSR